MAIGSLLKLPHELSAHQGIGNPNAIQIDLAGRDPHGCEGMKTVMPRVKAEWYDHTITTDSDSAVFSQGVVAACIRTNGICSYYLEFRATWYCATGNST